MDAGSKGKNNREAHPMWAGHKAYSSADLVGLY